MWATGRRVLDPRWWTVLILLVAAAGIVGLGRRALTAGVVVIVIVIVGANIGAGLFVFVGSPNVVVLHPTAEA